MATFVVVPTPAYFEITRHVLALPNLHPDHDGVTVAQITDLHLGIGTPRARIRAAIEAIRGENPDLVFLTGDYVTNTRHPIRSIPRHLDGLVGPAFAVLGNHDHWVDAAGVREALAQAGCTVLANEAVAVEVRGRPLFVVGVDDEVTNHHDVPRALRDVPADAAALVLAHSPATADELPHGRSLACFSGHTHGGHFVVGNVTAWIARRFGMPYLRGHHRVRDNHLYVNRGLGFGRGGLLPRLDAEPEVAFFELRAA